TVEARVVASILFTSLYSPLTASIVPALLDDAERNEFQGLFALGMSGGGDSDENMSLGMRFSVLCTEDADRVSAGDVEREIAGTVFGSLLGPQIKACEHWPRGI